MPPLLLDLIFPPLVTPLLAALQFHLSSLKCELRDLFFPIHCFMLSTQTAAQNKADAH